MTRDRPKLILIAGPNGAGKTTLAPVVLRDVLAVSTFVNADVLAHGLSGFDPEAAAMAAGRIMLERIEHLAQERADFAFETTLASRSFAPWIRGLIANGYEFHLVYLSLPTPEAAIARVHGRVRAGGHFVPDDTVRRRHRRGLENLHDLYHPLASTWRIFDTSDPAGPRLEAQGGRLLQSSSSRMSRRRPTPNARVKIRRRAASEVLAQPNGLNRALMNSFHQTVELHRKLGLRMVFCENGRVVRKRAEDVQAGLRRKKRRSAG